MAAFPPLSTAAAAESPHTCPKVARREDGELEEDARAAIPAILPPKKVQEEEAEKS